MLRPQKSKQIRSIVWFTWDKATSDVSICGSLWVVNALYSVGSGHAVNRLQLSLTKQKLT